MRKFLLSLFILFLRESFAQQISGLISDSSGKQIPYASVFIKGRPLGTNSNAEGKYVLQISPGTYTLVCQHVGYQRMEKTVTVLKEDLVIHFQLGLQEMIMEEVVLDQKEDPAYGIIRQVIREKDNHQKVFEKFSCEVYTKGILRLEDHPDKFMGQKIDFEDGDTSRKRILYLSETIAKYSMDGSSKENVEVLSTRVSGQSDGFGLSLPRFISFYKNSIQIGSNLNPRGFISPVADNALNFYNYKLEGTYFEEGREISHIRVMPKRKYEPLFSGYIDIVANEWRIHSVKLNLTRASQMEVLDTLQLEQLYRPLENGAWFISSQVIYPVIRMLGFHARGSFVNIYSRIEIDPPFGKKHFGSTVIRYTDSSNHKTNRYWEQNRPIPLLEEELRDYQRKDSLELVRKDPAYLDSIDRLRNKIKPIGLLLLGQTFSNSKKRSGLRFQSITESFAFNPAEGWVIYPSITWSKRLDTSLVGRRSVSVTQMLRYGFANRHFNPYLTINYSFGKKYAQLLRVSGGSRVFQFNNDSPIGERGNTITSLWDENNRIRSYEAKYFRMSFRRAFGIGISGMIGFQYQDRKALNNRTAYTWRDKEGRNYSPNYPSEIMAENIKPHQVAVLTFSLTWQFRTRYVELQDRKMSIGSSYPIISFQFFQSLRGFAGSTGDFSKWKMQITDGVNLKLLGKMQYRLGMGGFIRKHIVEVPDYNHFNGNLSTLATEYVNSFQLLPVYRYSNRERFYTLAHIEHNFNGFLTNQIPGIRSLNLYLVTGANAFYINPDQKYMEWFIGLDNILKQLRIDFVQSHGQDGLRHSALRIGFRVSSSRRDDW